MRPDLRRILPPVSHPPQPVPPRIPVQLRHLPGLVLPRIPARLRHLRGLVRHRIPAQGRHPPGPVLPRIPVQDRRPPGPVPPRVPAQDRRPPGPVRSRIPAQDRHPPGPVPYQIPAAPVRQARVHQGMPREQAGPPRVRHGLQAPDPVRMDRPPDSRTADMRIVPARAQDRHARQTEGAASARPMQARDVRRVRMAEDRHVRALITEDPRDSDRLPVRQEPARQRRAVQTTASVRGHVRVPARDRHPRAEARTPLVLSSASPARIPDARGKGTTKTTKRISTRPHLRAAADPIRTARSREGRKQAQRVPGL